MDRKSSQAQRESELERETRENQLREYLNNSLFNYGLPRAVGTNTCYINSVFVAMRCLYNLFTLLVDSRVKAYFLDYWNDEDPLWNFSSLMVDMCKDVSKISNSTLWRLDKFIEVLRANSNQLIYHNLDQNPVPIGNAQGDPLEVLLFLKDLLLKSIESIRETRSHLIETQPQRKEERLVCDRVLLVGEQLERILALDLMPIMSNWSRCPYGHITRQTERTFFSPRITKQYPSIRSVLLEYFLQEEFEKHCEECGNKLIMAVRGYRLEEMPEKLLVIGLSYYGKVNEIVNKLIAFI